MSFIGRLGRLSGLAELAGRSLLDALYPLECAGCGGSGKIICDSCVDDLPVLSAPYCVVCATPGDFARCQVCAETARRFDGIRAPFRYSGAIRKAILEFKYSGIKAAAPQMGDMLAEYLDSNPLPGDVLVPVPMHRRRLRERGYNQAELLARRVADRCGLDCAPELLYRTRHVGPQAGTADAAQRATNVVGSVAVTSVAGATGTRVILVDDVVTTGNTLETCADALKRAGAVSVWGLTLAVAGGTRLGE
ncbi:MAG: ComF family protein [Dehalococcoidia bacterium]|nr:ComF family protein [Dehalococcoidia bacterium]